MYYFIIFSVLYILVNSGWVLDNPYDIKSTS